MKKKEKKETSVHRKVNVSLVEKLIVDINDANMIITEKIKYQVR